MRLQAFASFWADVRTQTCCLFASDEEIRTDLYAYNCETCAVADALAELEADPANLRAWQIYQQVATRFNADVTATGLVLQRLTAGMDDEEFSDCMQRLAMIYDILQPPVEMPSR